ncbi:MAG: ROK family protein [Actinobacteria bacterium]|nr:ROK family protein [Actinomycetota bacterium]
MTSVPTPEPWPLSHLGVDVGGTNIKAIVLTEIDGTPTVTNRTECRTLGETAEEILAQIAEIALGLAGETTGVGGLGFSLPGAIDRKAGTAGVMPNLPGSWHDLPVRSIVEDLVGLPTSVVNDARAFTLAESRLGAARGLGTVVGVTLGTGFGGGVAINGHLHEGASGFAGEIGHQILAIGGERCGCGNLGCAETFVRTQTLLEATGLPSVHAIFTQAAQGDPVAAAAVNSYIAHLAVALANVHTLLCPDAFVIGGGIAAAGAQLFDPLLRQIRALITFDHPESVHLRPAELGSIAGAIGAGLLAMDGVEPRIA